MRKLLDDENKKTVNKKKGIVWTDDEEREKESKRTRIWSQWVWLITSMVTIIDLKCQPYEIDVTCTVDFREVKNFSLMQRIRVLKFCQSFFFARGQKTIIKNKESSLSIFHNFVGLYNGWWIVLKKKSWRNDRFNEGLGWGIIASSSTVIGWGFKLIFMVINILIKRRRN